ncbi:MAG: transcription termination factor NusA [bacterium]|nr:transcription termination factor NusA [bacterium]
MPIQARTEFAAALNQLASEKGVDVNVVIEAIQQAALAAYRKDLSLRGEEIPEDFEELKAEIDPASGEISILRGKENVTPPGFARIAAQTAKQVIMQRLHEAEKDAVLEEYEKKVGTVISGTVQRQEGNTYFVDLGRAEGVMPYPEQTRDEYYHSGQRLKFFIKEIREGRHGPEVVVSRADPQLVAGLFAMEVPEIQTGSVVVKDIAREAGARTKIAAVSTQEGVDPVGSLVGQKGVRVQAVMNELGEERIDIISFSEDPARYIAAALSPAKEVQVTINEKSGDKVAKVRVPSTQTSLAIGKGGQNVRLAARLTGWKIDIEGSGEGTHEAKEAISQAPAQAAGEPTSKEDKAAVVEKVEERIDQATAEEAVVDATQPEPVESEGEAAAQAEADIEAEDKKSETEDQGEPEASKKQKE